MAIDVDKLLADAQDSRKYREIDPDVVLRVCRQMAVRYDKHTDALHAVKRELHRIHAAFVPLESHTKAAALIDAYEGTDMASDKTFSRRLLALHASTAERLPHIEEAYAWMGEYISTNDTVADIGCGFAPFALPFLPALPAGYTALDVHCGTAQLLNAYFAACGWHNHHAGVLDAAAGMPPPADVVLMLKLLPLLEQQTKGRAGALLAGLSARRVIVSFPAASLTGKKRGMESTYAALMDSILPERMTILDKRLIGNELFYALVVRQET